MPEECHIGPLSEITLVSGLDEDTLLWAQVASSVPNTAAASSSVVSATGHGDVTPDSQMASRRRSIGLFEEVDSHVRNEVQVRVPSSCSTVIETDKDTADTESSQSSSLSLSRVSPHIFEIAGLSALSRGDVLSLHLVDSKGRNVCMLGNDGSSNGHVHVNEDKGHSHSKGHGQHTVFGDRAVELEHKSTSTSISPFGMSNVVQNPVASCSIQ